MARESMEPNNMDRPPQTRNRKFVDVSIVSMALSKIR